MQHHWTMRLVSVLTPVVIYTKVYSAHDPAQMCVKYLPWLSWSWLHHPVCWPRRSLSSGSCTCWSLVPASGFLWHTNHVVGTFTTFVYSSMAKSTLNLIYTEYKWHNTHPWQVLIKMRTTDRKYHRLLRAKDIYQQISHLQTPFLRSERSHCSECPFRRSNSPLKSPLTSNGK